MKLIKRIKSLSQTDRIYVSNGKIHFTTEKEEDRNIWVTMDTDMSDGTYHLYKNELMTLKSEKIPEMNMGADLDALDMTINIEGIPYDIVNFVCKDDVRESIMGIYFDKENKCVVATNGIILHSHRKEDIQKSILIRPELWKLMRQFKLNKIYTDGKFAIAKSDSVTIISKLITESYPLWFRCIPQGDTHIEITKEIKKTILEALKVLKPHLNFYSVLSFEGTWIKIVGNASCPYKVDIGVELFPDKKISLNVEYLKKVLKLAQGRINFPSTYTKRSTVTIIDRNTTTLIMGWPTPYDISNMKFAELKVA